MSEVFAMKDVASIAKVILTQAMEYCAQKMGLDNWQAVIDRMREGDGKVCEYCHYSVAKQVAESLGALDENIKEVYIYDYDATPEDLCFRVAAQPLLIHLIVWAQPKTAALNAMVEAWDCALAQSYAEMLGERQPAYLLDVQVVNDADVGKRIGYGALLSSLHHRPIQIWKR